MCPIGHAALPAPGPPCVVGAPICLPAIVVATACILDSAIVCPSSSTARSSAAAASARVLDGTVAPSKPSYLYTAAAHAAPAATSTCVPRVATAAPSESRPPARWRHDMRPCQRQDRLRSWGPDLLTRHRRRDGLHARQCDRLPQQQYRALQCRRGVRPRPRRYCSAIEALLPLYSSGARCSCGDQHLMMTLQIICVWSVVTHTDAQGQKCV